MSLDTFQGRLWALREIAARALREQGQERKQKAKLKVFPRREMRPELFQKDRRRA